MCTSLAPGFYLRDKIAFNNWRESMNKLKQKYKHDCVFGLIDKYEQTQIESASSDSNDSFTVIHDRISNTHLAPNQMPIIRQ